MQRCRPIGRPLKGFLVAELFHYTRCEVYTVNVDIFAQYIFSCISGMTLGARQFFFFLILYYPGKSWLKSVFRKIQRNLYKVQ